MPPARAATPTTSGVPPASPGAAPGPALARTADPGGSAAAEAMSGRPVTRRLGSAPAATAGSPLIRPPGSAPVTVARQPAPSAPAPGGGAAGGASGGSGGDVDADHRQLLRRLQEEQEQVGHLIPHPF